MANGSRAGQQVLAGRHISGRCYFGDVPLMLTVDANVLYLILPETASDIVRPTGNAVARQMTVIGLENFPGMNLVTLTDWRAKASAKTALTCRLRGADAVYVAVAQEFGTTLITWDAEMLAHGTQAATVMHPATDWRLIPPYRKEQHGFQGYL